MNYSTLQCLSVQGSPEQMGTAQGEALRDTIPAFIDQRLQSIRDDAYDQLPSWDEHTFKGQVKACLEMLRTWYPLGYREHCSLAAAAGVDAVDLYAAAQVTDMRDLILAQLSAKQIKISAGECTAFLLPPAYTVDSLFLAGQTWDLHPFDLEYIIAIHRLPDEGPETWSVTCTGCATLMGMNQYGLSLGTTNIQTQDAHLGVGYLSILHRAIHCPDSYPAAQQIIAAPRAAAHNYWLADAKQASMVKCSANKHIHQPCLTKPIIQTNHCLDEELIALEVTPPSSSSLARYQRMHELMNEGKQNLDSIRNHLSDRHNGVDAINRYPEDNQGAATNACVIAVPQQRTLWACQGPADRGNWVQLQFERA